ncbi:MAG: MoaD/ThiS family protein [Deltaproteobacteria bacterium]|nr:MoaD/ThiS family protein [bacterium]MCB9488800.1 MoaD/ThiS family protein [Deltaproteobacteria bacterium]
MKITLLCFSHVKEAMGHDQFQVELPEDATARHVLTHVREATAGRLNGIPMRVAINQHYVNDDARLAHGDEVALIPPVQGG